MPDVGDLSPAKRALLERALRRRQHAALAAAAIPRRHGSGPAPLSFSQQRMWFLHQWEPASHAFNGARAFRLRGPLDVGALQRAFETVLERHQSLRTVFSGDREPVQVVLDRWSFELALIAVDGPADLEGRLRELSREPFDLSSDLMLRATLLKLGSEDHALLVSMHHIAADAHSEGVLFSEVAECYAATCDGRESRLPELAIQYADYAVWQRERLQGTELERLSSYWAAALEGAPELLRLPTDRPRPAVQRHEGSHQRFALERELGDALVALGREQGATFFMTMLAAFAVLLYRLSGEEDVVIGSPIAGRNLVELQGLIGFFSNTMALRLRVGGNPSFREVLDRARATALGAYDHQDLPFEKVVEKHAPRRDPSYNPVFQVNFRAQANERPALELPGIAVEPLPVDIGFSRFDLALELELSQQAFAGYFEYNEDLFDGSTVAGFEQDLRALLEQVVRDPDEPVLALTLEHGRGARRAPGRSIRRRERG
ncbi:MAG TPA: condensation domain-containing protein [Solirubrobacteraceae bacterium]